MIHEFILIIMLYGNGKQFMQTIPGFTSIEACSAAARDFNGFAQNKDTGDAMAFCIEKK
jgi:hypothetical protein